MPEHLRALVVILALAGAAIFAFEKAHLSPANANDFKRLRNLWIASTLAAFLSHDFWLYAVVETLLILLWSKHSENRAAVFLLLLFVIPVGSIQVPGLGLVNYIFDMNHPRLLSMLLLVPCVLLTFRTAVAGSRIPDGLFLSYILLTVMLQFRQTTFTDTLRFSFHTILDSVLPYYAFSRSLKDMAAFRQALLCFLFAGFIVSLVAMFEVVKHWLLYRAVQDALGISFTGSYLGRADLLRANGPAGHPIALGYVMMVATGFYLYLRNSVESALWRHVGLAILAGGLMASLSRGPWLGAMVLLSVFAATGDRPLRNLAVLGIAATTGIAALVIVPGGEKILNLLPFIGTTEAANIEYRSRLFSNALAVIQRNLWFGSVDYLQTPEMQEMIQGQGIIDIVNSYVRIALAAGLVGLALFAAFFASAVLGVRRAMKSVVARNSDEYLLGRSLLATAMAVLFTIATVSSIVNIPIIYWSLAGMLVGYARMIRSQNSEKFSSTGSVINLTYKARAQHLYARGKGKE
jgi:O-antigen ligase